MGVCRLPGPGQRHRRLDIIVVPYKEFACARMYFTGSAHFNRSMRALAKTKQMSLSEHSLNKDVVRRGNLKVYGGTPFATPTEEDVFSLLGIPYRPPHERDWWALAAILCRVLSMKDDNARLNYVQTDDFTHLQITKEPCFTWVLILFYTFKELGLLKCLFEKLIWCLILTFKWYVSRF